MKILIVDDSDSILTLISGIVIDLGYQAITATNGKRAIEACQTLERIPDLVILDVNMPGIDGYETAKALKQIADANHLPIIFLTGSKDKDIQEKCLNIGDDYIAKPFSVEMVAIKIKAHLRVSLLTTRMQETNLELKRRDQQVQNEHRLVESIFANQFKKHISQTKHIKYHMSPVSVFNGDVLLTSTGPADNFYILIGDVTGHGLAAAVGAIPIYSAFRTMASKGISVGSIAYELNISLLQLLPDHMMMAAAILEINTQSNQLTIWSGGMPDLLIDDGKGKIKHKIRAQHAPLAALSDLEFSRDIDIYQLKKNDRIYLYTDGIQEARNTHNEMFGEDRLLALFNGQDKQIFGKILKALENFTKNSQQDDDITLIEFSYQPLSSFIAEPIEQQTEIKMIPWEMNFDLNASDLRETNPIPQIIRLIENAHGIDVHQDFISTILSELYNNALEHGLLELDSSMKQDDIGFIEYYQLRREKLAQLTEGNIRIKIHCTPSSKGGNIIITVNDSGKGFDPKNYQEAGTTDTYGRGLSLTRKLCKEVRILKQGRCVLANYQLQR